MAFHCQCDFSCSRVLKPVAPASVGAWVEHLQSDCFPCPGQTVGLWRAGAASVPLVSGCPPLYCGVLEGCWAALVQNHPCPPHSSTPFCRTGRLSLRTDLAKSAWTEAAGWARWSHYLCPSRCYCHLSQNRKTVGKQSIAERAHITVKPLWLPTPSGGPGEEGSPRRLTLTAAKWPWTSVFQEYAHANF